MTYRPKGLGDKLTGSPCLKCGVEDNVYDDGEHTSCLDCGASWPSEIYKAELKLKLSPAEDEMSYSEKIRVLAKKK